MTAGGAAAQALAYTGGMKPLRALLAPLLLLAFSVPALAEKIPLKDLSAYLNSLTTAETAFTQTNADGSTSTGRIYIKRPGRIRFEYAPPERTLVLASAGAVAIFDTKSNQPPEQYPLRRTPLNLILKANIDLGTAKMVMGHTEAGETTRVAAQDPGNPEYGTIELVFTANPVTLRQWVITDDLGQHTTVTLGELVTGKDYPSSLFSIGEQTGERRRN